MNLRLIFFDTETTGLSPDKGDKIVEIGCVEMINGIITDKYFHCYINPERIIPAEVIKIHGITNEKVKNSPKFRDIHIDFKSFIEGAILIAHNSSFDMKFINYELNLLGLSPIENEVHDTLKIARKKFPGSPASLDALCKRFNVDLQERSHHGALLDSKLLACVYRKMVLNDQSHFDFKNNKDNLQIERIIRKSRNIGLPLNIESTQHDEFVNLFSLWKNFS